jgi:hypothetical protein
MTRSLRNDAGAGLSATVLAAPWRVIPSRVVLPDLL